MRSKRSMFVWAVALITALATATPAMAGRPPKAGGSGLTVTVGTGTVESGGNLVWANSVGDEIPFLITVTNTSGGDLTGLSVTFAGVTVARAPSSLKRNASWTGGYGYTVTSGDFQGLPISEQSEVVVGRVVASGLDAGEHQVTGSADAVMTAYPVAPCPGTGGSFTYGPNAEYSECAFSPTIPSDWTLTTTLPKPKKGRGPQSPSATVRDGIPGNWCNVGDPVVDGTTVVDEVFFPGSGECARGGAGGDPIPIRNADTFYLATSTDNVVVAAPSS